MLIKTDIKEIMYEVIFVLPMLGEWSLNALKKTCYELKVSLIVGVMLEKKVVT